MNVLVRGTICGGTIIGPNAIVTSAECLYDPRRERYVEADDIDIVKQNEAGPPTHFTCEKFAPHWKFLWARPFSEKWAPHDLAGLFVQGFQFPKTPFASVTIVAFTIPLEN